MSRHPNVLSSELALQKMHTKACVKFQISRSYSFCRFFLSKLNSFRDIIFSNELNLAQVDTNHVWKNQLSRSNGLVTVIRTINAGFSSLGWIVFEISFFQKIRPIAQVDTNHVWKNQLSSFYSLVTKCKNVDFYTFSCVVFEISFFPSFARTSSSNLHCRWHIWSCVQNFRSLGPILFSHCSI